MASNPITSWQINAEKVVTVINFIFLVFRITADGDCSHETKRSLILGRKAMTNLDSILKSRDITLPTKVHLVKTRVFFSCHGWMWKLDHKESWALKNWCFWTVVFEKSLESSWTARRSNQSILKEISPEYSLEGLMLKLKCLHFGHGVWRTDSLDKTLMLGKIEGRRRRDEDEMAGGHHWLGGHELEQALGAGDGQGSLVCCNQWGRQESDTTERLNNSLLYIFSNYVSFWN